VALTSSAITAGDLLGGKYDNAQLTIFATDWSDVSKGIAPLMRARIGEVEAQGSQFRAEVRGLAQSLQQGIVKLTSIICRAELGDAQCKVQVSTVAWAASTAYAVVVAGDAGAGALVKPTTYNGFYFEATAAGTSGGSEPAWPTSIGSTVTDGGVTWTAIDAWIKQGTVTHAFDRYVFRDTGLTEAGDWFRFGLVAWTGGDNDGLSMPVREHLAGGWVTLREAARRGLQGQVRQRQELRRRAVPARRERRHPVPGCAVSGSSPRRAPGSARPTAIMAGARASPATAWA